MDRLDELCPEPEGVKRDEDEDLRIIAELNNPRIYKDVQKIIQQEQRVKTAITRNKPLLYPCKCRQLCEFGELLKTLYDAFENLYEQYEQLHLDYTTIFRASGFLASGRIIQIQEEGSPNEAPAGAIAPVEVNMDDFEYDVNLREERKKALADEDIWRKTYELHMECVRLFMLKVAMPDRDQLMEWVNSHIWASRKCICYHCDYRDALLSYRHAILSLHLEYTSLYANYAALIHSSRTQESRQMTKTVSVRGVPKEIIQTMFFGS